MEAVAEKLVNLTTMARIARVPSPWLREEATAGRVPALKAGSALLFNVAAVRECLTRRAAETATPAKRQARAG